MSEKDRPFLTYIELHLFDGCNLNCKGCSHFSPLCNHLPAPDSAGILRDIQRLTKLFSGVGHLRLLGGEPLLNPELLTLLTGIRALLPKTKLTLVTNGLLVEQWGTPLSEKLRQLHIILCITGYPCNQEIGARVVESYRAQGNLAVLTPRTDYFRLFLRERGESGAEGCELRHCILLREGKLYRCSIAAMIFAYNQAFGCAYPEEQGVDLYGAANGREVFARLRQPGAMCRYCSDSGTLRKWAAGGIHTAEEWRADHNKE